MQIIHIICRAGRVAAAAVKRAADASAASSAAAIKQELLRAESGGDGGAGAASQASIKAELGVGAVRADSVKLERVPFAAPSSLQALHATLTATVAGASRATNARRAEEADDGSVSTWARDNDHVVRDSCARFIRVDVHALTHPFYSMLRVLQFPPH